MKKDDIVIITSDHGNDPTMPGTDHTREYVSVLIGGTSVEPKKYLGIHPDFTLVCEYIAGFLDVSCESA